MGSLKALATQKTGKFEERAKLEKYRNFLNITHYIFVIKNVICNGITSHQVEIT